MPTVLKSTLHICLELAHDRFSSLINSNLESLGLIYRHYLILSVLDKAGGQHYQQELGEMVGANRSTMVQLIDQLEQLDLVRRTQNPENRRQLLINMTEKGIKIINQAHRLVNDATDHFAEPLGKAERKQLLDLLCKATA
jgi:MarR family transcriptional regulator, lower aerobic nicotinate degradation pathway regulator